MFFFRKVSHSPSDRVTYGAVLILSWSDQTLSGKPKREDQTSLKYLICGALFENPLLKVFATLTGTGVQLWKRQETFLLLWISCNRLNQMVWCNYKLYVLFHTCESSKFSGSLKYSFILTMLLIIWMLMVMKWETVKGRRADYWKHRIFPCRQPIPLLLLSHISSNISWIFCFRFSCYFPQHVAFPSEQTIPL